MKIFKPLYSNSFHNSESLKIGVSLYKMETSKILQIREYKDERHPQRNFYIETKP